MRFLNPFTKFVCILLFSVNGQALAQFSAEPEQEPDVDYEVSASLSPAGASLLGDSINTENGGLSFSVTDVSIPGNSALPVAFSRTFTVQKEFKFDYFNRLLGGWNIDVPFITAKFDGTGWKDNRCTQSLSPYTATSANRFQWVGARMFIPGQGGKLLIESVNGGTNVFGSSVPAKTTTDHWRVECLSSVQNGTGEGFIATSPSGTEYHFNYMASYDAGDFPDYEASTCPGGNVPSGCLPGLPQSIPAYWHSLLATHVEDVNGNWVKYEYATDGRLTRIHSNDGREITVQYTSDNKRIASITTNTGRQWTYNHVVESVNPFGVVTYGPMDRVTLPDGRYWEYDLVPDWSDLYGGGCDALDLLLPPSATRTFTGTVKHPDGIQGEFFLELIKNGQNAVPATLVTPTPSWEPDGKTCNDYEIPSYRIDSAVISKKLIMLGGEEHEWTYWYEQDDGYHNGTSAPASLDLKKRIITDPEGNKTHLFYNRRFGSPFEGEVIRTETYNAGGSVPVEETDYVYAEAPSIGDHTVFSRGVPPRSSARPLKKSTTTRGVDIYNVENTFNMSFSSSSYSFNQPTKVKTWSNLHAGARETDVVYAHDKGDWILNLPSTITKNGNLFDSYVYDSIGRVTAYKRFGATWKTYGYHTTGAQAGSLAWAKDAQNKQTSFNNWKRGRPQSITRPDSVTVSRVVDNNGWVTSETNARGFTTGYTYNNMGWITGIDRPAPFADSTFTYDAPHAGVIAEGASIRQIHVRGSVDVTTNYDGFLRPMIVKREAYTGGGTTGFVRTRYDGLGRVNFTSFQGSNWNSVDGVETTYDALGRVTQTRETVAPYATTTYEYLSDNRVRVTDPMGGQTTTKSSGYGSPGDGNVIQIIDALNASTDMTYDIYGNITQFAQAGTQNGYTASVTRNFWYDTRHRLCRHATPEMGDELFSYDSLDRLQYSSRGEASGTGCATPSSTLRTALTYDALDRVTLVNYPAGTSDIATTYDANGNETKVTRGGTVWDYAYDALDQITMEKLAIDSQTFQFDYARNANGYVTSHSSPSGATFEYSPDGLGRPTSLRISGQDVITGVAYHPNGQVSAGNYTNGYQFSQSLNARQLVSAIKSYEPGGTNVVDHALSYNQRGQVTQITDYAVSEHSKTFGYDAKGRLLTATGLWGAGSYKYDALDNLRQKKLGSRTVDIAYNNDNLVSSVTDTANPTRYFVYDDRGNTTNDGRSTFVFDAANQAVNASGSGFSQSYVYDGNLKRVKFDNGSGGVSYRFYSRVTGRISLHYDSVNTIYRDIVSIGPMRVMAHNGAIRAILHGDHLGSAVAHTNWSNNALWWREAYTPYGELMIKTWDHGFISYTGHMRDNKTKLQYMQARHYDPTIGRFLSTDPIGYQDQFNLYAYVANDPINKRDPDGRCSETLSGSATLCGAADAIANAIEPVIESAMRAAGVEVVPEGQRDPDGIYSHTASPNSAKAEAAAVVVAVAKAGVDRVTPGKKGKLPKPPRGPGKVPKAERDSKRTFSPSERAAKRQEQGNQCANGCGTRIDETNSQGHHIERHADGGPTTSDNHAEVCIDCHKELHSPD